MLKCQCNGVDEALGMLRWTPQQFPRPGERGGLWGAQSRAAAMNLLTEDVGNAERGRRA